MPTPRFFSAATAIGSARPINAAIHRQATTYATFSR